MMMFNKVQNQMKTFYNRKNKILKIKLYKRQMIIQKIKTSISKKTKLKISKSILHLKMNLTCKKINNRILIIQN